MSDSFTYEDVMLSCKNRDIQLLKRNDQFSTEHTRGDIFDVFQEGNIDFLPTYKYDPGESIFHKCIYFINFLALVNYW